ncbi:hypothetical protein AMJ86_09450 [bacterium SM23_57]|jgi:hypothetical protein|nr:MAG: hypothetical protein AMJ86_09450 [bacterium SM23_57]
MDHKKFRVLLAIFITLSISLACGIDLPGDNQQATLDAMSTSIILTATAASKDEGGADSSAVQTAQAEATQQSQEISVTKTAIFESQSEIQAAENEAAASIKAEIPIYDLDPDYGQFGWVHDPVTLEIEGYQQNAYANDYMHITASDFVIAADITWDTQYGTSGCGFMFRSDGNQNKPNQYNIMISRAGLGHAVFMALADGELANYKDFYIRDEDKSFDANNGSTNRLVVVVRGNNLEIFTNGVKVGEIDTTEPPQQPSQPPKPSPPANADDENALKQYNLQLQEYEDLLTKIQDNFSIASINFEEKEAIFTDGFLAMVAISESGHTRCDFNDSWLWLLTDNPE